MKILLVGGGSGGSVSPLLAVAEKIKQKQPGSLFLFVGGFKGPEREMAEKAGMPFVKIPAGKLRRYFSLKNLFAPFLTLVGFILAIKILKQFKPRCVFGTGSFLQVPVIWAAWFLKIPSVIHQQDIIPSLANKLCQWPAKKITVTFEQSAKDFSSGLGLFYSKLENKAVLTGNPFRHNLEGFTRESGLRHFGLSPDFPTLLVLGGGTGAEFLNKLVEKSLGDLIKYVQIIHSTGRGKITRTQIYNRYKRYEFISEMGQAFAASDFVLSRAGLSTITELSNLQKVSILVPIPKTHQEINALLLMEKKCALVVPQKALNTETFVRLIRKLIFENQLQKNLQKNIGKIMPKNSAEKISDIIIKLAN